MDIFGPLKRAYKKLLKRHIIADNNYINKKNFLLLYLNARAQVFTSINICSNFIEAKNKPLN